MDQNKYTQNRASYGWNTTVSSTYVESSWLKDYDRLS